MLGEDFFDLDLIAGYFCIFEVLKGSGHLLRKKKHKKDQQYAYYYYI